MIVFILKDYPKIGVSISIICQHIILGFSGKPFKHPYFVSARDIIDSKGCEPTPAVGTVLLDYVLHNEVLHRARHEKVSFRDFTGAGPLVSSFTSNTNRLIARSFAGRLTDLEGACRKLAGVPAADPMAVDLHMKFEALPQVPLYLAFNDREEDLPAQCNLLFEKSAETYLSLKSCFVLGTFLAGNLI